jgi:hypothetical protein
MIELRVIGEPEHVGMGGKPCPVHPRRAAARHARLPGCVPLPRTAAFRLPQGSALQLGAADG